MLRPIGGPIHFLRIGNLKVPLKPLPGKSGRSWKGRGWRGGGGGEEEEGSQVLHLLPNQRWNLPSSSETKNSWLEIKHWCTRNVALRPPLAHLLWPSWSTSAATYWRYAYLGRVLYQLRNTAGRVKPRHWSMEIIPWPWSLFDVLERAEIFICRIT